MSKSYVKTSTDGLDGSGKTCTMAQLAVGLAKEYGNGKPVYVLDTNDRWPAWKQKIFDVERVPIVIVNGQSIAAVQHVIDRCADEQGSVLVADDLSVPWDEGLRTFSYENGLLPFERRQQLMNEWNRIVEPFQLGEFDAIACGRLGYHWERTEDEETGAEKLIQGDSKFNAGGGKNFAYDCILELEMRRRKRRLTGWIRGKTSMEYLCDVIKDANGVINGQQFTFSDFPNGGRYERGDYKRVLDAFRPHIEFRRKLQPAERFGESSKSLIVSGKTAWAKDKSERGHLLEEIDNTLTFCFGDGKASLSRMFRNLTLEHVNGFSSWSRMEEECDTLHLENVLNFIKRLRIIIERDRKGNTPNDQNGLMALLIAARTELDNPGREMSINEILLAHSKPRKQPISISDAERCAEVGGTVS